MSSPFDTRFQVGEVVAAEAFPETDKPAMTTLQVDLGDRRVTSVAQTGFNYDPDDLVGRQVLCATNLGSVQIAGVEPEALTVGVPDADGHPVLVAPDDEVPLGGELY